MSFILKGSQISVLQLKGWFKSKTSIQEYRNELENTDKFLKSSRHPTNSFFTSADPYIK
jgi:hypothetical protein